MNVRTLSRSLVLALLLGSSAGPLLTTGWAQTAAAAAPSLHGAVSDPTGAVIPGATVSLTTLDGHTVASATTGADGTYNLQGAAPGNYILLITAQGFASMPSRAITLHGGEAQLFNATLKLATEQQTVQVTEEANQVGVAADENANAIVLKGDDLAALSDDPDELSDELTALAGPAAGPSGGQIYVDGFTAGQLPPKSAIREIRINQNPYGAQYDKLGFGRVEILTKPGTDKFHGQFFAQGNARQFNTGNPFASTIPDYHTFQFNGTVSGAINKNASFFLSAEQRNIQDDGIVSAYRLGGEINGDFAAGDFTNPADFNAVYFSDAINQPRTRTNISPRLDLQLGAANTVSVRYQFYRDSESNQGVEQFNLRDQAYNTHSTEHTLQLTDTVVISPKIINETHVQILFDRSSQTPLNSTPQVQVQGLETFGGNSDQFISDRANHYEVSNMTELNEGPHAMVIGGRLRAVRDANSADSSFNGLYTFGARACPSVNGVVSCPVAGQTNPCQVSTGNTTGNCAQLTVAQVYAITLAGQAAGESFAQIQAAGGGPSQLNFVTGNPKAEINNIDGALYFQDDWKVKSNITFSYGVRWETQNNIHDKNDWAPRLALAYGITKHGKPTKDVIRAGFGFFYDRFGASQVLQAARVNGITQQQTVIQNPTCYTPNGLPSLAVVEAECAANGSGSSGNGGSNLSPAIYQINPRLHASLNEQESLGIDHQLLKQTTLSATYIHSHGVHQYITINANAPYFPSYDAALGNVYQYFSEGDYNQNQLFLQVNANFGRRLSFRGFYGLSFADSDTGGVSSNPSNSLNLKQDYGRASFDTRNRLFVFGSWNGPHYIRVSPFIVAASGQPFNITSSQDLNDDSFFNDRPSFAAAGSPGSITNSYGTFNPAPAAGSALIPVNYGNGPSLFTFNMRLGKTWGFGPRTGPARGENGPGGGGPPPPGRGGRGGGPGGPGGAPDNTGHRYNLNLNAQALNLFNIVNLAPPTGTLSSPSFGRSNALAGQIFSSGSASRRIYLQAVFTF